MFMQIHKMLYVTQLAWKKLGCYTRIVTRVEEMLHHLLPLSGVTIGRVSLPSCSTLHLTLFTRRVFLPKGKIKLLVNQSRMLF